MAYNLCSKLDNIIVIKNLVKIVNNILIFHTNDIENANALLSKMYLLVHMLNKTCNRQKLSIRPPHCISGHHVYDIPATYDSTQYNFHI